MDWDFFWGLEVLEAWESWERLWVFYDLMFGCVWGLPDLLTHRAPCLSPSSVWEVVVSWVSVYYAFIMLDTQSGKRMGSRGRQTWMWIIVLLQSGKWGQFHFSFRVNMIIELTQIRDQGWQGLLLVVIINTPQTKTLNPRGYQNKQIGLLCVVAAVCMWARVPSQRTKSQ